MTAPAHPSAAQEAQARLIREAMRYLGTKETIGANGIGTNRGIRVDYWNFEAGADPNTSPPWCAGFFGQMGIQAVGREAWGFLHSDSVQEIVTEATKRQCFTTDFSDACRRVIAGVVWWYDTLTPARYGHIGIVTRVDPAARVFDSIEGNTNTGDSRDGYEVALHKNRPVSARVGFLLWPA